MLSKLIIKMFQHDLINTSRDEKRAINNVIDDNKWMVAYPACNDGVDVPNQVLLVFTNVTPVFIEPGYENLVADLTSDYDNIYWQDYTSIAPHMMGTYWIKTSELTKAVVEPLPCKMMDDLPVISHTANTYLTEAVLGYMGTDDYVIEAIIESYLSGLSSTELSISDVFVDVDKEAIPYGIISSVIRYNGEVIGYLKRSGREMINTNYYTQDMRKFQDALKDIIDKCQCYDKMSFKGVIQIGDEDADIYLPVPGYTDKIYGD